jgi:hypothetical protein
MEAGMVHDGVPNAYSSLRDLPAELLCKHGFTATFVTGHPLGGAMAK